MTLLKEEVPKVVKEGLEKHYLPMVIAQFDVEVAMMDSLVGSAVLCISENKTQSEQAASAFQKIVNENWKQVDKISFADNFQDFQHYLKEYIGSVDDYQVHEQSRDRFYSIQGDSIPTKLLKGSKRFLYHTSMVPINLSNLFRESKKPTPWWRYKVPTKKLVQYHFQNELKAELNDVSDLYFRSISKLYQKVKVFGENCSNAPEPSTSKEEISKYIKESRSEFRKEFSILLEDILSPRIAKFQEDFDKVGTIESTKRLSDDSIEKNEKTTSKSWEEYYLEWQQTIYSLFEEWRLDLNLYHLRESCNVVFNSFKQAQQRKLLEQIDPEIQLIFSFIDDVVKEIGISEEQLGKTLKKVNFQVEKQLELRLVPKLTEKLTSQKIINLVNKLLLDIRSHVGMLSDERVIVKADTYDKPTKSDDLKKISPYELINFEALEAFEKEANVIKQELFISLENITIDTANIGQIISFSCESAVSSIDQGKGIEEARQVVLEGIERAKERLSAARSNLKAALDQSEEKLYGLLQKFEGQLMELTINENVTELRLRITKAKAAKQADELKIALKKKIENRSARMISSWNKFKLNFKVFIKSLGDRFILTASKPSINREVSDFLVESQHAIDSLPLIYRRLYQIEPLEDLELFEGREKELGIVNDAYKNWTQGRFAAVTIVGEKWGGLTTFINYLLNESKYPSIVTRIAPQVCHSKDDFMALMQTTLKEEGLVDLEQLIDYLNSGAKKVIVLEDLQNLYLRRVGGFDTLQLLFQLITKTNGNVFWITSTTLYTWKYLCKAISINEFFSYVVELGTLSEEQIVNIIWKRNQISGFKVQFEPEDSSASDKKFLKLGEEERQKYLKQHYFAALNDFAKSNVSLALIFWLLSTKKVDKSTITIGTFNKPNLNFISVLSMEKVYTLHALILHDGLTEISLKDVLNISLTKSNLNLLALVEDGIVMNENDEYLVNPMVYRNTISMLKSKNLIH